ncbi:MAG: hypothetical protein ABSG52_14530 [Terriglobales bacterium]|jgi:hypothetical protein
MKAAILMFAVLMGTLALGQAQPEQKPAAETPTASPADVKSIDSIVAALYDVISGPAGQKRDWNRFRSLFWPGAHLIPVGAKQDKTGNAARVLTVEDYVTRTDPFVAKDSFYESAVANRVDQWAQIASVFSTYESRHAKGEKPFARGINSIQVFNDGQRWWVLNILWESESEQNPLSERLLKPPVKH